MPLKWDPSDRLGILKPSVDAHVLGITAISELLSECGCEVVVGTGEVLRACDRPEGDRESAAIEAWIRANRITRLGFSYRLNPEDGADLLARLARQLERRSLFAEQGGPVVALYFAGLPETCRLAERRAPRLSAVFDGDETPQESLQKLGIRPSAIPEVSGEALAYDSARLAFGREIVQRGDYQSVTAPDRAGYPGFGGRQDSIARRLAHAGRTGSLPVTRAHMGPYLPDRSEAVRLFLRWTADLAASGHLDVLSIGTSQLTQSRFGEQWGDEPNGGGVPLNSPEEFADTWRAARPMLVRAYAGTKNVPSLARMLDETIHNAWHALSLWWFCRIDNRGPCTLRENLEQQVAALRYVAAAGRPYEPNVPHHFAFRGADDATCVASAWIAARTAKSLGIRLLIAQVMLNTPKYTWGVQDLAKARAMLGLLRGLEDDRFSVVLQTRAGLDYFSHDPIRARAQLAAATALMDDIEPRNPASPQIVHVVSWSEGSRLADPSVIAESVRISRWALAQWRRLRSRRGAGEVAESAEVEDRTRQLVEEAGAVIRAIEREIADPWSTAGLYRMFAAGFLPVPYLWECREELARAADWRTRITRGAVRLTDKDGLPLTVTERIDRARGNLRLERSV